MWFPWFLAACGTDPAPVPPEAPAPPAPTTVSRPAHAALDFADPAACEACHGERVAEWRTSMHAHSHPDRDPIYAAMRALRMKKQGEAIGKKCQRCHNPLAPDAPDSPAGRVGVGCGACHSGEAVDAGEPTDGRAVCLTCHEATQNPQGAATCTTGPENTRAGGPPCAACHLPPAADGGPGHTFPGPHRAWAHDDPSLLQSALAVGLEREGNAVRVTVTNTAGHGFPTGFPGRVAAVRVTDGTWSATPFTFRKVYVDASGEPTLPPFAARLDEDTRLEPAETREAVVEVPDGVGELRAELVFRLLPEPAAAVLGVADLPEAQPRVIPLPTR